MPVDHEPPSANGDPRGRGPKPPVLAVGAVVFDRQARVLLIRRARPPAAGSWTLPGGRVDPGETPEAAVVRELREETSLDARVVCGLGTVMVERDGYAYAIVEHLLVPVDPDAPLQAADDAAAVRWVRRGGLHALGVTPEVIRVIEGARSEARTRHLLDATRSSREHRRRR